MKRKNFLMKRIASMSLVITLTVGMFTGIPTTGITAKAANDYGISAPTKDANGNVVYDCVTFGSYWQEDTNGNGIANKKDDKTPIKWRVLAVNGDDAFLVANQILDYQRYNDTLEDVTWENCTMRSWLNGYGKDWNICETDYTTSGANFISNAFTASEQAAINATTIENKDNQFVKTAGGNTTTDKIFLLSLEDISKAEYGFCNFDFENPNDDSVGIEYSVTDDDWLDIGDYAKLRTITSFAGSNKNQDIWDTATGVGQYGCIGTFFWWLRSPGGFSDCASTVGESGYVDDCSSDEDYGFTVDFNSLGVVPALHLNLSSSTEWRKAESVTCTGTGIGLTTIDNPSTNSHTHTWDAGTTTTPATENATGIKTYTCRSCDETMTEVIPKLTPQKPSRYGLSNPTKDSSGNIVYDCITFGKYWQEDTNGDGKANKQDDKTPIKWRVLSVDEDDAFLLADQALDISSYNDFFVLKNKNEYVDVTWENCTIRSWLNGYNKATNICERDYTANGASFISNAFTEIEQTAIKDTTIENKDNQISGTIGGNDTTDKLYLLSLEEITKSEYGFSNFDFEGGNGDSVRIEYYDNGSYNYYDIYDYAKLRTVTAFAGGNKKQTEWDTVYGTYGGNAVGTQLWWLRSPGTYSFETVSFAYSNGSIGGDLYNYDMTDWGGVVPALHLNLSSSNVWKKVESVVCTEKGIGLTPFRSEQNNSVEKHTHTWDTGTITTPPTESSTGIKTYNCSNCNEIIEEVIPKLTSQKPSNNTENSSENGTNTESNTTGSGNSNANTNGNTASVVTIPTVSKVSNLKATSKKKALSISWKKVTNASGYELQYSTKSSFKGAKTKKFSSSKKSYTISKLKSKKKYYIRIRAFKNYVDTDGKTQKAIGKWGKLNKKTK